MGVFRKRFEIQRKNKSDFFDHSTTLICQKYGSVGSTISLVPGPLANVSLLHKVYRVVIY